MTSRPPELQQIASPTPAHRMGAILLGMGALHFAAPKPFDTIVPPELPGSSRFYTYASGVAELTTGAMLLAPRARKRDKHLPMRIGAIARLPLQIPMITEALKIYRSS